MKIILWLAKLIVMGFWVGAIYFTFIHPLPGKISSLIPAFAVLMLFVHGIQAALLTGTGEVSGRLMIILWRTAPLQKHQPQLVERASMALLRRLSQPVNRLLQIGIHHPA